MPGGGVIFITQGGYEEINHNRKALLNRKGGLNNRAKRQIIILQ